MLPVTPLITRIAVMSTPIIASSTVMPSLRNVPDEIEPLNEKIPTSVASLLTTIWAFCIPMKAMKSPMPTETATLIVGGIMLKIASRTLHRESSTKITPSTKTAVRAISQLYPILMTTV